MQRANASYSCVTQVAQSGNLGHSRGGPAPCPLPPPPPYKPYNSILPTPCHNNSFRKGHPENN